jgi:threonine/homoserine/homoserine lactone efflux protein
VLTFALAVFFLIITPGPGVLSVAGVGASFGARPGARYIAGLFIGTNLVGLAVVSGLAAILLASDQIRTGLLIASVGYLLYLAAKIAFAGSQIAFKEAAKAPGIRDGLMLQAVNPKAYAVNTTLFMGFAFMPDNLMLETALKFLIMNAIWVPIHFAPPQFSASSATPHQRRDGLGHAHCRGLGADGPEIGGLLMRPHQPHSRIAVSTRPLW